VDLDLPHVFVGDEAFTWLEQLLKPFSPKDLIPERMIFNYHLSRARRVMENIFAIMASRFRYFHAQMNVESDHIETIVMTSCVLHNCLRIRCTSFVQEESIMGVLEIEENVSILLQNAFSRHYNHLGRIATDMYLKCFSHERKAEWLY
jgi:hypothetical protein